jgi:probable F420-dependent oxidoreductase
VIVMTVSAGLGIANFPFEDARGFRRWVDLCESGGVDSIWQSDRLIGTDPNLECMSVMAWLAGATRRLKFGMNVASLGLRHPILTAKACATIDVMSEGRLLPAFGIGSALSRDYTATGTPTQGRGGRMDESLEIISRLWAEEHVTFSGRHYQLDRASIAPRPIQQPLPLWVGGAAAAAIERTARWGTGWQAGIETAAEIAPVIAAIKKRSVELERPIDVDHFGAGFGYRFGRPDDPISQKYLKGLSARLGKPADDYVAIGDADTIMSRLDEFRRAGVHKFVLRPIAFGTDEMLSQTRSLIETVLPRVAALNRR